MIWQCSVCKYIHRGDKPPEKCPVCSVGSNRFGEIDEASIPEKMPKRKRPVAKAGSAGPETDEGRDSKPVIKETGFEKIKSLLVRHHAHPVLVHSPNGLLPVTVILWLMAWIFDYDLLAKAAFINLVFVVAALPFVIFTGILEWEKKYGKAWTMIFQLKIFAAALTMLSCIISLVWYLADPLILSSSKAWVFILISILMTLTAGIAGHLGGKLVFKD